MSLTVICDGDCLCTLLLLISRAAYRRLRLTIPRRRRAPLKVVLLSPPDTRQQVPERDVQLDWSRAPCVPSCQRPPHTTLAIAVLGAEHVPRHTDKRVKIPGGVRESGGVRCFRSLHSSAGARALVKPRRRRAPLKFESRPAGRGRTRRQPVPLTADWTQW